MAVKDLIILAAGVSVFYAGRIRQWRLSRDDRKIAEAIEDIRDVLNENNDKKGSQS
ncbi:hypothetical protein ABT301_00835 [Streptomyces sp. NPDC000987]|uniref:hypothetical protein n=1 Tax=Streptomyces sp. NPDC000987 TaxID=3154374 RepID=UPI00332F3CC7